MTRITIAAMAAMLCPLPSVAALSETNVPVVLSANTLTRLLPRESTRSEIGSQKSKSIKQIEADTEIALDGEPCGMADVPPSATVTRIVVGSDGVTVRRIEFKSK